MNPDCSTCVPSPSYCNSCYDGASLPGYRAPPAIPVGPPYDACHTGGHRPGCPPPHGGCSPQSGCHPPQGGCCPPQSCPTMPSPLPTYSPCVPCLPPGCKPPVLPPWERYCVSYSHVSGMLEEHPCKYTSMLGIRNRNKIWKINNSSFKAATGAGCK